MRRFLIIAFLLAGLCAPFSAAFAAPTCAAGVGESGGTHARCSSANGVFHVWKPSGFDASKPGALVVYVHGWSDQCGDPSTTAHETSDDVPDTWFNTPGAVYIDAAWTSHNLASQFSSGGISNAMYVAVQARTCGKSTTAKDSAHVDRILRWSDFNVLLSDLSIAGASVPSGPIVLMGHSGAYEQLQEWQGDSAKITHIIHLDTLYVPDGFASWLNGSGHTGTIVATKAETQRFAAPGVIQSVSDAVKLTSMPSALDASAKTARVLAITTINPTHMKLVTGGTVIPMLLQRVTSAGTKNPATGDAPVGTPPGTSGDTASTLDKLGGPIAAPILEIPIPNVTLTAITDPNNYSIPWIGQYVSGVYTFAISIVGLVAAVMMIIGGFQYLTSGGDNSKVAAGKKRIFDALVGLIMVLGSYVILFTINPELVQFKSLGLFSVQTETLGFIDGPNGLPPPGSPPPGSTPDPAPQPSGSYVQTCKGTAACLPYCRAAGCTTVYCPEGKNKCISHTLAGFEGVTLTTTGNPWKNDCDRSKFPNIPPGSPPLRIPSLKNVAANGETAAQLVIDGLTRASRYIDDHYAGVDIKISLSNCYRDTRDDFGTQCTIIMRPPPLNDPSDRWGKSTWPGSNPHSSGYGCDLWLSMGKDNLKTGNFTSDGPNGAYKTGDSKYTFAKKALVDILTSAAVGGRRLSYEDWHFNFGGFNNAYCIGSACP